MVYYLNAPWELLTFRCGEACAQRVQKKLVPGHSYFIISEKSLMNELDCAMNREATYFIDEKYTIWKGTVRNEL